MSNRRDFLLALGLFPLTGCSPIKRLLSQLLNNREEKSFSRKQKQVCRNYIQINHYGGPSRWLFDGLLKPEDRDLFYTNPMVVNRIKKIDPSLQSPVEMEYVFKKVGRYNMPWLWNFDIPTSQESMIPMANLTKNMLSVRGVHLEGSLGHPLNCAKMVAPTPGGISIDGRLADHSQSLIPAVSIGNTPANRAFKSKKTSIVRINSNEENYLKFLLDPFYHSGAYSFFEDKQEIETSISEALEALKKNNQGNEKAYDELSRARSYFRESIDGFLSEYDTLVGKYLGLINKASGIKLTGIDDRPIPGPKFPFSVEGNKDATEALGPYLVDNNILMGPDMRKILDNASNLYMAQEFAIAEYLITNEISTSVVIATESEMGTFFKNSFTKNSTSTDKLKIKYNKELNQSSFSLPSELKEKIQLDLSYDAHGTGLIPNFLVTSKFYYLTATCLNELIESLKNKNIFDETLVHLTAEFDRLPSKFLNGSGHNENAHVSSFFSGAIQKHETLGNIYTEAPESKVDDFMDLGTIGNGAPLDSFNKRRVGISNLSTSICKVLRIPPLVGRADPIFDLKDDKLVSLVESAKNVEGIFSLTPEGYLED